MGRLELCYAARKPLQAFFVNTLPIEINYDLLGSASSARLIWALPGLVSSKGAHETALDEDGAPGPESDRELLLDGEFIIPQSYKLAKGSSKPLRAEW